MPVLLEVDAGKLEYHKSNGAVQVLVAAGFEPEEQDGESVLVHAQTAENTDKARYVISRLKELL